MPFYLSPSVNWFETDLTLIAPAVSTSVGAAVGAFQWGAVLDPVTVSSETELVRLFGKPNDNNFMSFFTVANFLAYSNNVIVVRSDAANLKNAVVTPDTSGASPVGVKIRNLEHYESLYINGAGAVGSFAAKYPGKIGNSLKVSIADNSSYSTWEYKDEFNGSPDTTEYGENAGATNDGLHMVVVDKDGLWTGTAGAILEKFAYVSKASDAMTTDGVTNYYKNVLNNKSQYIWWMDHPVLPDPAALGAGAWGKEAANVNFDELSDGIDTVDEFLLSGGVDDYAISDGNKIEGFSIFANSEKYDISLVMAGKASPTVADYILANVAEYRRDCVAFISPEDVTTGSVIIGDDDAAVTKLVAYRNELPSTSYGFLDSGYKYQYDRYNDKYRWVPLNGDIAGLAARCDYTNDSWWAFAGHNRGQIKNVVKLAVNPNRTMRDNMFKTSVNPVVSFPGEGVMLYGDKTLLSKPSAFDAVNVRRLFIVLEKSIATASKYILWEFNDPQTRAYFKSIVEPFLRGVQGARGITDFRVKVDEQINTPDVVDRNEFKAAIFIKPNRAIRYIELNFVAARSGVSFEEIGA